MSAPSVWDAHPAEESRKVPIIMLAALCGASALIWVFLSGLLGVRPGVVPIVGLAALAYAVTAADLRLGLALVVMAVGISPEFEVAGIPNLRLEDFLMPVVALVWLSRLAFLNEKAERPPLWVPLVLALFISLISSLKNATYAGLAIGPSTARLAKEVEYALMFLVTFHVVRTRGEARTFTLLLVAAGALVGLYGTFQSLAGGAAPGFRVPGPPGETANILGAYLVFHLAIALGVTSATSRLRGFALPAFVLMFLPLLRTLSRSSYAALFASLLVLFLIRRARVIGTLLLVSGVVFAISSASERFASILAIFTAPPPSWEARVAGWGAFLTDFPRTPLLGRGLGSVQLGFVDSELIRRLSEVGILGTAAFVWLVAGAFRRGLRVAHDCEEPLLAGFGAGYVAGLAGLAVHAVAATTFTSIRPTESFFLATGLACAIASRHLHAPEPRARPEATTPFGPAPGRGAER